MWINPQTSQVYQLHSEIRAAFPAVSFPAAMAEEDIESVGLEAVVAQAAPAFNPITHTTVQLPPANVAGTWTQQWEVYALPEVIAAANLAQARAARWEDIKAERARHAAGGVLVADKWFHSDMPSRIQWLTLVMLGANVPPQPWKTLDNSFVGLTPTLVQQVFAAMITAEQAVFTRAEVLRAEVFASGNPAAVDITTGWPAIYGGA